MASIDATYAKQYEEFYIGLEGSFGSKHVSPRTLTSCFLSCVVCVEGIVTKCEWVEGGAWILRRWEDGDLGGLETGRIVAGLGNLSCQRSEALKLNSKIRGQQLGGLEVTTSGSRMMYF